MSASQSELRLARLIDERETTQQLHETLLADVEKRDDKTLSETENVQIRAYRERAVDLDNEIKDLTKAVEDHNKAVEESRKVRRVLSGNPAGIEADEEGIVYRSMAAYARDFILTRDTRVCSQIAAQFGDKSGIELAKQRLDLMKRTPANTLSSNVAGLTPAQHIAQIFQVIDSSRPLVEAAPRTNLERGQLTYPQVDTRPLTAVQSAEKTEAGNQGMAVSMVTATASTYLGGGDLSWQAINWSTPDALDLWFRLAAEAYAIDTEADAATVVSASAFVNDQISSPLGATPTFAELMTAIGAGGAEVYANSRRIANVVIMAPDRYWYALGLTDDVNLVFGQSGSLNVNADDRSLRVIVSPGLNAGEIIVGDINGLLVAETAGAPVELQVVEPAIGGLEVGIIGAFEAVVVDSGAFSLITTAS